MRRLTESELGVDFEKMGICAGDTILLRASLSSVGRIDGGADSFINALQNVIGPHGTIVSLAFTGGEFIKKPDINDAFDLRKKSYAGALPNTLIKRDDAFRSRHPMCSFVAVGKFAKEITENHDEKSAAYEPVRKIMDLGGKCMLIGCVDSSPGFTTAHLAEADLGLSSLAIFAKMLRTYYKNENGEMRIFRRCDPGLCSNSFYKFYALYVKSKILKTGFIGDAYSILAPASDCYKIEYETLAKNKKFNLCGSPQCFTCNAGRWDRLHCAPGFLLRYFLKKMGKTQNKRNKGVSS